MKNTLETRLGIFFAIILIAAAIIVERIGGLDFFASGFHVRAIFKTVNDLKVGDPVRLAGVQLGRVEDIQITNNAVEVTMKVNRHATIHTDSKASVRFLGLMGQNYIYIDLGTTNGSLVTSEGYTLISVEQPDLSSMLSKLDNAASSIEGLSKSLGTENLSKALGPLTDFFKDNRERLSAIVSNAQAVTTQIAEGKGTVGKLIMDDSLHNSALNTVTNLDQTVTEVRSAVDQARAVVTEINEGRGTIGKLVHDETLYKESTEAMTNAREILQKVNRGQGSIGKLVNDESLLNNIKLTLQKLDKATEGLEDQGPLSLIGVAANSLF
jgi:phospholipid/cholesterol/gamma-HCH transport system substrate-binding protein